MISAVRRSPGDQVDAGQRQGRVGREHRGQRGHRVGEADDARTEATAAARARAESDAAWRHLTVSTDRDDAAAERDPLGTSR